MKFTTVCVTLMGSMILVGCNPKTVAYLTNPDRVQNLTVQTKVSGAAFDYEITSPASPGCSGADRVNGCLYLALNNVGQYSFEIQSDTNDWYFKRMQICPTKKKKGKCKDVKLPDRMQFVIGEDEDATLSAASEDGMFDIPQITGEASPKEFFVYGQNVLRKTYYYLLQACPNGAVDTSIESPDCRWNEDPPAPNKGRR